MNGSRFLGQFIIWREKHLPHKQFIYILSFFIGIFSGLAAVLLKNTVHYIHHGLLHSVAIDQISYLYLLFPFFGIVLTVLFVRYFVKDKIGHGVSRILFAISKQNGRLRPHNNYSSLIASAFTVGFGGSVGLEAPIVLTGSSIGSTLGRLFRMNYKTTIILIGCGAAGAISGIFKAPIAAVIFGLEVLMLDLTMWSIIPLLISAVSSLIISYFFLGKAVVFSFELIEPFILRRIPYYILLGIFCGLISYYFTRGTLYIEGLYSKVQNAFTKTVVGGLMLGVVIFFLPPLYGEGYNTLDALLNGNPSAVLEGSMFYGMHTNILIFGGFLVLLLFFKVIATSVTNGAGGVGGIFAPTLFMGGVAGYLIARLVNLLGFSDVPERNFTLVGMAGMMAGVMHAPMTAIFLIAEITDGYALLLPLILTSTIAYITIMYFEPHSIYTIRLAQRGELITHHKDKAVLTLIDMEKVIEKDFKSLSPGDTLEALVLAVSHSKRNIFPVLMNEMLVGVVLLNDVRHMIFNTDMYKTTFVRDLMMLPPAHVSPDDSMEEVMKKFEETGSWNLPVIKNGKYIGFLSKSKMFSVYRKRLLDITADEY